MSIRLIGANPGLTLFAGDGDTPSAYPLYSVYKLAPRVAGLTVREEQQLGGIVMKLGSIPVVCLTIAVMWFR